MKPGIPTLRSARFFDQIRERYFYLHYSFQGS
jgi:hypothetical protein